MTTAQEESLPPGASGRLVLPDDEFNRLLVANVHPPDWVNPTPARRYNLVVVGAGTAGLVTAAIAAGLGARVALVERHLMGGDCLNVGCVPSKGLVRAARAWAAHEHADGFGITASAAPTRDFEAVMRRVRRIRADMSRVDSARRFRELGVDVFIGPGRFTGRDTLAVGNATLRFARAAICTGGRAAAPAIPGLSDIDYLTNETLFSLTECPPRLAVIGAGPIGCEMAQSFARFGSQVTLLEMTDHILPREDADAAMIVQERLAGEGIALKCGVTIDAIERRDAAKIVRYTVAGATAELETDDVLVAVGRAPNVEDLGLEEAGVAYDRSGVAVDRTLRTSNRQIYAAGDICFPFKFTHTADALAQIVIQNALFPHPFGLGRATTDSLIIPWCTFTQPEIAHVGLHSDEARARDIPVETFTQPLHEVDRAVLDGEDEGFIRVHVKKDTDTILGATIVADDAGNMISEVTLAMKSRIGLTAIGNTIHPYPTQAEALRKAANQMRKARFSARQRSILSRWFRWTR